MLYKIGHNGHFSAPVLERILQAGSKPVWPLQDHVREPLVPIRQGKLLLEEGSGCGTLDKVVAFDNKGPRFESSHRQLLLNTFSFNYLKKRRK